MSKTVQWKRGNNTVNSTYVGAQGEITINTDTWNLHVHDGITPGGYIIDSSNGGGSFSNLTVTGNISAGNLNVAYILNTNTLVATGNITAPYFFGNGSLLTGIASYSNANVVAYGQAGWSGNIIPAANAVYTLGNITNQWANLWVAGNTIYIGNIALGINNSNILTINSEPILSNNSNTTIGTTGNITAGNLTAYRITGSYANVDNVVGVESLEFTNGNEIDGNTGNASLGNILLTGNISANNMDGNLTLPGGGSINGSDYDVDITAGNDGVSTFGHINFTANGPNGLNSLTYNSLGEITVVTAGANDGLIKWVGNSSGDGAGYTTMVMVPDTTREGNDQYIILDPTDPNHIHIRAGGTQDNSQAVLILGGETSHFRVESGLNPDVYISANSQTWTFGTDGTLTLPSSSTIKEVPAPIVGNAILLTPSGGNETTQALKIYPTEGGDGDHVHLTAGGGSTELYLGNDNQYVKLVNGGNIEIRSGDMAGNTAMWSFGTDGKLTLPDSGFIQSYLGTGSSEWTAGPESGSYVSLASNNSNSYIWVDNAGAYIATNWNPGAKQWTFDNTGNLTLPSNTFAVNYANGDPVSLGGNYSDSNVVSLMGAFGNNNVSTTGNITAGNFVGSGANVELVAGTNTWTFDEAGLLTLPGNITGANVVSANTFVSTAFNVVTAGNLSITSQYGLGFTGTILEDNGTLELIANGGGSVYVGWDSLYGNGLGNIATVSFNEVGGGEGNILLRTGNRSATEYNWVFGNDGSLSTPGNVTVNDTLFIAGSIQPIGASPAPSLSGFSSISTVISGNPNEGNITAHNYLIANGGIITSGNITANYLIGNGSELTSVNAATVDILNTNGLGTTFYPTFVENRTDGQILRADVDLSYRTDTNTLTTNAISSSGNISASYFIGNGALLTGISAGSNYGNSNVTALMSSFGSNTIATTGNITAGNLIGNISITGNVTGTSSNVELVAGAYTWTFNNAGNLVLPGNTFAVNYANGTAVTLDRVYLLEAYANETYTLPGSFTEDPCRYSIVSSNVNVSSSWFDTGTYRFTPQQAGYWEITASYDIYRNTESSMVIKKNTTIAASAGSFNAVVQQVTKIIYLNGSTDYIQIFNTGGAALSRTQYDSRSWFQARWIGE